MSDELNQEVLKKDCEEKNEVGCSAVGYQEVNVSIPITIKPFGEAGNAKTQCMGRPIITSGISEFHGKPGGECKFTISQKLRVEVPVIFGARAEVGDAAVRCGYAENTYGCDEKCD